MSHHALTILAACSGFGLYCTAAMATLRKLVGS